VRRTSILFCALAADVLCLAACEFLLPLEDPETAAPDAGVEANAPRTVACGDASCPVNGSTVCCRYTMDPPQCSESSSDCLEAGGAVALACDDPSDCPPLTACCTSPKRNTVRCGVDCNKDAGSLFICNPDAALPAVCTTSACEQWQLADNRFIYACH
jgi:hypothetical protein